jgi:hypothetical protein
MKELWRLFRVFNKSKKTKVKKLATVKLPEQGSAEPSLDGPGPEISTVLDSDDPKESAQEKDFKRELLQALAEIADLHERIRKYVDSPQTIQSLTDCSIFIWRRPASSKLYGMVSRTTRCCT